MTVGMVKVVVLDVTSAEDSRGLWMVVDFVSRDHLVVGEHHDMVVNQTDFLAVRLISREAVSESVIECSSVSYYRENSCAAWVEVVSSPRCHLSSPFVQQIWSKD